MMNFFNRITTSLETFKYNQIYLVQLDQEHLLRFKVAIQESLCKVKEGLEPNCFHHKLSFIALNLKFQRNLSFNVLLLDSLSMIQFYHIMCFYQVDKTLTSILSIS